MSVFTGTLKIEEIIPGKRWRLLEPIHYEVGEKGSNLWVVVPANFETDGTTIPLPLRVVLAVWGTYGRAACLHDYLYSCIREGTPCHYAPTRKAADHEFYNASIALGTRTTLALAMWAAIRLWGWRYI